MYGNFIGRDGALAASDMIGRVLFHFLPVGDTRKQSIYLSIRTISILILRESMSYRNEKKYVMQFSGSPSNVNSLTRIDCISAIAVKLVSRNNFHVVCANDFDFTFRMYFSCARVDH